MLSLEIKSATVPRRKRLYFPKITLRNKKRPHLLQDNGNWLPSFEGPLALRH